MKRFVSISLFVVLGLVLGSADRASAISISGLRAENIMGPGAQIKWITDVSSDSRVAFGTVSGSPTSWVTTDCFGGTSITNHCVNLTDLSQNTLYYYHAESGSSTSAELSFISAGTGIPTAPSNLRLAQPSTASTIYLAWNDNSTNEDKFNIERKLSAGTWSGTGYAYWQIMTANLTTYTDTTVAAGTSYDYRAQACLSGAGCSEYTYLYGILTPALGDIIPPTAPVLSGYVISSSQTSLSWSGATDDIGVAGYKIYRNGTLLTTVTTTSHQDSSVVAGTTYSYNVTALDVAGNESSSSNSLSLSTPSGGGGGGDGSVPATFSMTLPSTSGIPVNIYWTTSSGASYYEVWRRTPPGTGTWSLQYSGPLLNYFDSSGIASGMSYEYYIKACNTFGCTPSNYSTTYVSISGGIPTAPSNLRLAQPSTASAIYLAWNDNSMNEDKFNVERKLASETGWSGPNYFFIQLQGSTIVAYTDTSVTTGFAYDYRVQACASGYGCSPYTTLTGASTASGSDVISPSSIYNFIVTSTTANSATITWQASGDDGTTGLLSYYIARYSTSPISTETAWTQAQIASNPPLPLSPGSLQTMTVSGLASQTTYYFAVKAYDEVGNVSPLSGTPSGTTLSQDFPPPSATTEQTLPAVTGWGVSIDPTQNNSAKIGISFNVEMDQARFTSDTLYLLKASDLSLVPSSIQKFPYYINFVSSLVSGAEYISVVKSNIKSLGGAGLATDYTCRFTAPTSGYLTACPVVGTAVQAPPKATPIAEAPLLVPSSNSAEITVLDFAGNPVPGAGVHIFSTDFSLNYGGTTNAQAVFTSAVTIGGYWVEIFAPAGRTDLMLPSPSYFQVLSNEAKKLTVRFGSGIKTVSGVALFSDGTPVTDAEAGAYSSANNQWVSIYTDSTGRFTLRVGPGVWKVGIRPRDSFNAKWSWTGDFPEVVFGSDQSSETKIVNFTVGGLGARLTVRAVDQLGMAIEGAGIVVDTASANQFSAAPSSPEFRKTDSSGAAVFSLKGGHYYIRTFVDPNKGYLNPEELSIELLPSDIRDAKLVFKKRELTDAVVNGTAKLDVGTLIDASVWAWSERGRFADTKADSAGNFVLRLPIGDKWHIAAGKEVSGGAYKSSDTVVDTGGHVDPIELILIKYQREVAPPVVAIKLSTEQIVVQAKDSAKVVLPPGSAGTGGNIKVELDPTVEAPSQAAAQVIGTAYDVTVKNSAGGAITQFQNNAEVTLPYNDSDLAGRGLSEDTIIPAYFDAILRTWVKIDNFQTNKDKNYIVAKVKHLTRFAIIAAADITPPEAPTSVKAASLANGKIRLTWINPKTDFHDAIIYRSETSGSLGSVIFTDIRGSIVDDSGLKNRVTYYYTVRAVDYSGNESANTTRVSAVANGTSIKESVGTIAPGGSATAQLKRTLKLGDQGDDVKTIQGLLLAEGVYPVGLLSGYFGPYTQKAIIKFQEKYAPEILLPAGLTAGTGFVGVGTLKKMNLLLSGGFPALASDFGAIKLSRTLKLGDQGEGVKIMQSLLLKEGVYPGGLLSGYFGPYTQKAIIKFQEKYAPEILLPAGLTAGTGFVGVGTLKKMNELLSK